MAYLYGSLNLCLGVDLDPNYTYTMDFNSKEEQDAYFNGLVDRTLELSEFTFLRQEEAIKIEKNISELEGYNYLFFFNSNVGIKTIQTRRVYNFITRKEYINENTTKLYIKTDVFQTYMFDFSLNECFIDREHQDRWEIINNTDSSLSLYKITNAVPENIDVGDRYLTTTIKEINQTTTCAGLYWVIVYASGDTSGDVVSTSNAWDSTTPSTWKYINNTLSIGSMSAGGYTYLFPVSINSSDKNNFYTYDATGTLRQLYSESTLNKFKNSASVYSIKITPYSPVKYTITKDSSGRYILDFNNGYSSTTASTYSSKIPIVECSNSNFGGVNLSNWGGFVVALGSLSYDDLWQEIGDALSVNSSNTISKSSDILSIVAKWGNGLEAKLRNYPYHADIITNNIDNPFIFKSEYCDSGTSYYFQYVQNLGYESKTRISISNYLDKSSGKTSKSESVFSSNVNELPIYNDAYASYLNSSKASATSGIALNVGSSVIASTIGLATGGLGATAGLLSGLNIGTNIANQMIKQSDLKTTADTIRNAGNSAQFAIVDKDIKYYQIHKVIPEDMRERVYRYFHHFGYKANEFKVPNLRSRYYFNYIKTIGCNLDTNIDSEYRKQIEDIFNNGVTIWHYRDGETFKGVNNYNYENIEETLYEAWKGE